MADPPRKPAKGPTVTDAPADRSKSEDVALVCGASADGETLGVVRKRGERVEAAIMQKAAEGQPIHGELVRLKPREEPLLFDVESIYAPPPDADRPSGRPAQVASDRYRRGWDRLFKRRRSSDVN